MILDATAGNRMMWKNKHPPMTLFMDKRPCVKPDVVAVWEFLPFREQVFTSIIFDPPHLIRTKGYDERISIIRNYGCWKSRRDCLISIIKALKEFGRVSKRICFKWSEDRDTLSFFNLVPVFLRDWRQIQVHKSKTKGSGYIRGNVYWATFVRKENVSGQ